MQYTTKGYFLGITAKSLGLIAFTIMSLGLVKTETKIPVFEQIFMLYATGVITLIPVYFYEMYKNNSLTVISADGGTYITKNRILYLVRALTGILAMQSWVYAMKYIGTNEATLVTYLIPFITTFFASLFGLERISVASVIAMLICFSITAFSLNATMKLMTLGFVLAFLACILWSLYNVVCKAQTKTEHYILQVYYTFLYSVIIMVPFVDYGTLAVNVGDLLPLFIMGLLRITNVILIFLSFKYAPVSILMPFGYLQFVFMAIGTYYTTSVVPSISVSVASALIILINTLLVCYQTTIMNNETKDNTN